MVIKWEHFGITSMNKIEYIKLAIEKLNKAKHLDIHLDHVEELEYGIKIDISSKDMMWPGSMLIIDEVFSRDTN